MDETSTLKVSDTPKVTDTLVELFKIDMETGKATAQGNASLEGAEFVWKYYDGYYTKDNLPSETNTHMDDKDKSGKKAAITLSTISQDWQIPIRYLVTASIHKTVLSVYRLVLSL